MEGLRVIGDPKVLVKKYSQEGSDEILLVDAVASYYDRNSLFSLIEIFSEKIFIPLTLSGGIRNFKDIEKALKSGADKVSINTAATKNPIFIDEASKTFGSSTIVVAIEAIKQPDNSYLAYTDNEDRPASTYGGFSAPDLGCLDCEGNIYDHDSRPNAIVSCWGAIGDLSWIDQIETEDFG